MFSPAPEQDNVDNDLTPLADDGGQLLEQSTLPNNLDSAKSEGPEALSPEDNQTTEAGLAAAAPMESESTQQGE